MDIARIKSEYFDQGYVIVDDAIDPGMLDRLEAGARSVWSQVREGAVDVAGSGPDGGSIFGLLAPEFGEPVFVLEECSFAEQLFVDLYRFHLFAGERMS